MSKSPPKPLLTFGRFDQYAIGNLLILALILTTLTGLTYVEPIINSFTNDEFDEVDDFDLSGSPFIVCLLITLTLLVITTITFTIYKLLSWLEERCECGDCSVKKFWNCGCKLFCWIVTVTKWVAIVITVTTGVLTYFTLLICIFRWIGN